MKKTVAIILAVVMLVLVSCTAAASYEKYLDIGTKYLYDGNYEQAILFFTKAIEVDGERIDAYLLRAEAYEKTGEHDKALADYRKVLELDADNEKAIWALAVPAQATIPSDEGGDYEGNISDEETEMPCTLENLYLMSGEELTVFVSEYLDFCGREVHLGSLGAELGEKSYTFVWNTPDEVNDNSKIAHIAVETDGMYTYEYVKNASVVKPEYNYYGEYIGARQWYASGAEPAYKEVLNFNSLDEINANVYNYVAEEAVENVFAHKGNLQFLVEHDGKLFYMYAGGFGTMAIDFDVDSIFFTDIASDSVTFTVDGRWFPDDPATKYTVTIGEKDGKYVVTEYIVG